MAVHSTQSRIANGQIYHVFCDNLVNHPLLYDPIIQDIAVLYDDYSCGREDFWDGLATFMNFGKRITVIEHVKNQMTLDYLNQGKHYTHLVRYEGIRWPTRRLDMPDFTYEAIGWVGTYWPGCGLDKVVEVCESLNIPLMAFGLIDKAQVLCPVGYAYWKSISANARYFVNPEECIREAAKCRWIATSQDYSWLYKFCTSGGRTILSDMSDLRAMFNVDSPGLSRYMNLKHSAELYSKPSDLFIKW